MWSNGTEPPVSSSRHQVPSKTASTVGEGWQCMMSLLPLSLLLILAKLLASPRFCFFAHAMQHAIQCPGGRKDWKQNLKVKGKDNVMRQCLWKSRRCLDNKAWDPFRGDAPDAVMRLPGYQRISPPTRKPQQTRSRFHPQTCGQCLDLPQQWMTSELDRQQTLGSSGQKTTYLVTTGFLKELLQMKHLKGISSSSLLTS